MNRLSQLSLALSAALLIYLPSPSQAIEPRLERHYGHQPHYHAGLRITSVAHRSPAAQARLECGDVIVAVDGRGVCSPVELDRAVRATGFCGILTVRDSRSGRLHEVRVYPDHGRIGVNVAQTVF